MSWVHTVVPPDLSHFGWAALASCHGADLPLFQLNLPPPWQSQDKVWQLMCLETSMDTINSRKKKMSLLTNIRFQIRIWCFLVYIPAFNHVVPLECNITWKCGSKLIVIFLLPFQHYHCLLEQAQESGTFTSKIRVVYQSLVWNTYQILWFSASSRHQHDHPMCQAMPPGPSPLCSCLQDWCEPTSIPDLHHLYMPCRVDSWMKNWIGNQAHVLRCETWEWQTRENYAACLTATLNWEVGPGTGRVFGTTDMRYHMRTLRVCF